MIILIKGTLPYRRYNSPYRERAKRDKTLILDSATLALQQEKDCRPQTAAITIRIMNSQTTAVRSCA